MLVLVVLDVGCHEKVLQCRKFCKQVIQGLFLHLDESNCPDLQGRDLRNSPVDSLPKSVLMHHALCEISQEVK